MLDHEEKFLFKEEILHLANSVGDSTILDNVEDLLTDVITSPRFDSEVFTLERSLRCSAPEAGTTLVGLLTVARRSSRRSPTSTSRRVHERLVAWRARFGLAIDNALNFLNNPDGIRATTSRPRSPMSRSPRPPGPAHAGSLQQRAAVLRGRCQRLPRLVADVMERLAPYLEPDAIGDTLSRLRDAVSSHRAPHDPRLTGAMRQVYLAATGPGTAARPPPVSGCSTCSSGAGSTPGS